MCCQAGTTTRPAPQPEKPELADVLRAYASRLGPLTPAQWRAVQAIIDCRTAALGGHVTICDACGHQEIGYNSCRSRCCPKCQSLQQERWLDRQEAALLPVAYHHVVFTIPDVLNPLFLRRPAQAYGLLFAAVSETLIEVAANPARLGVRIGFTAILHTWTQKLLYHPHIHCVVPGGGLDPKGRWTSCPSGFFLPVRVLAKVFCAKLLAKLELAYADDPDAKNLLIAAAAKTWVVFSKPPVAGGALVLRYLGRYTHRTAISNSRIISIADDRVTFAYRDRADHNRKKTMTLDIGEFIRRFLLHVLPKGFVRTRHYGLLANANRNTDIPRCHELLGHQPNPSPPKDETWQELVLRLTGKDVTRCPKCDARALITVEFNPVTPRWALPGRATSS